MDGLLETESQPRSRLGWYTLVYEKIYLNKAYLFIGLGCFLTRIFSQIDSEYQSLHYVTDSSSPISRHFISIQQQDYWLVLDKVTSHKYC